MPNVAQSVPNCIDVPQKRWGWHWKVFERARFPSYNRNRSMFGRMLNQLYEGATNEFQNAFTIDQGLGRAEDFIRRQGPDIIENTYQTVYENTAQEFALGWRQNVKQEPDEDEEQDLITLAALAVRDFLTAQLFQQQQLTLQGQVKNIVGTHSGIARTVLTEQARAVLGIPAGQPIPAATPEEINQIALSARNRFRNDITPTHSKYFSTTETVSASNLGILAVARAQQQRTGQQYLKMWLSQRDSRVRDSHTLADSERIPLDSLFSLPGGLLAYPGDWTHGARLEEIINCRCTLIFFRQ